MFELHKIMTYRFLLTIIFLFLAFNVKIYSQDMLGNTLGNYSGVNGIQLNPSIMHSSKTYIDVNFLSGDLFLENDYLFVSRKDYRFNNFFKPSYEFPSHPEEYGTDDRMFYWENNSNGKNAFMNVRINGPGIMVLRNRHAFALTTSFRTVVSGINLPYSIANFAYLGLNYRPQHNINYIENKPFKLSTMAWAEIGLSYAYEVYQRNYTVVSVGLSVKRLFGYSGAYGYVTHMDYMVPDDSTIIVNNVDAEIGYSLPIGYGRDIEMYDGKTIKGGGFSFDAGVTYTHLRRLHQTEYFTTYCAQPYQPYDFRLGIALVDIGAINFKDHAVKAQVKNYGSYWENVNKYDYFGVDHLLDTISYQFFGNDTSVYVANSFYLWLPTSLSIQFDYHLKDNWFVNGSLMQGIPISHASLVRPSVLSITPRYETHWFEANLPVSLYDWYLPRVGLSVRLWWFTLGTEKLGQFFSFRDFSGMDFYFGIKFFFDKGNCKNARQKGCADREYKAS